MKWIFYLHPLKKNMMTHNQHSILFLATEYESGMRPYACTIIHNMWNERSHAIVVIKDEKYKQDFADLDPERVHFIHYPTCKLGKLVFRFFPNKLIQKINQLIATFNLDIVYSLTGELVMRNSIKRLQENIPLLYTSHDAIPHETKQPLLSLIKEWVFITRPQRNILKKVSHIVTNRRSQHHYISHHYPHSHVHYAPFPSLINPDIARGGKTVPEIADIYDYILFFGNIHLYKGVDLLYHCYHLHPEIHRHPLVLAGAGHYYFSRYATEKNVRIINRFVADNEVSNLFQKAAVVVYPYISATQSGVISIASYFNKPIILSDVDYFKEVARGYSGVTFFKKGDIHDLAKALSVALSKSQPTTDLYNKEYSSEAMVGAISSIIQELINNKYE